MHELKFSAAKLHIIIIVSNKICFISYQKSFNETNK
jgi:hypothetical protein